MVSHHPAKFVGRRHCNKRDIMVLICHKNSQGHVIKRSCDFVGGSPLW